MTTKTAGGRISSRIALTLEAQSALDVGAPVSITGPYECDTADSGDTFVGIVSVANVKRGANGAYPTDDVPGEVTVESIFSFVGTVVAGTGGVTAGDRIFLSAAGAFGNAAGITEVGVAVGIALTTAAAAAKFDLGFF
jgi:hypothetical protein